MNDRSPLTLSEKVDWAAWLMANLAHETLDARYPDWYDWQDFLANGTAAHAAVSGKAPQTALEWLETHPEGVRDLNAFLAAVDYVTPSSEWQNA